jgi:hypothetical protein
MHILIVEDEVGILQQGFRERKDIKLPALLMGYKGSNLQKSIILI